MSDSQSEISVFCGNFGKDDVTEKRLEEIFEDKDLQIKRIDMKRGFAFVYVLGEKDSVQSAVTSMHGSTSIEGGSNVLRIEIASGRSADKKKQRQNLEPSNTLFVVNFGPDTKEQDIRDLYEKFGEIVRLNMRNNFAFVGFASVDQAVEARTNTNGGKLNSDKLLSVEFAEKKEPRPPRVHDPRGFGGGYERGPPPRYDDRYDRGGPPPRYDNRYDRGPPPRDWDRRGGGYDDRGPPPPRDWDRRGGGYDDRGPPPRDYDRRGGGYDDRRGPPPQGRDNYGYDDRGRGPPPGRGGYDDHRGQQGGRERSREREQQSEGGRGGYGGESNGDGRFRD